MTGSYLRWIPLFLGVLVLTAPFWGARAGDAYKPTPAAASPAKSSKSSDNVDAASDDSTMDVSDEPAEGAEPIPPKTTHSRPARRNAAPNPTDSPAGDNAQGTAQTPAE